jgi:hypothetical protein
MRRPGEGAGGGARAVAETVQHFITAMDSLKLNLVAVDQVGQAVLVVCTHMPCLDELSAAAGHGICQGAM